MLRYAVHSTIYPDKNFDPANLSQFRLLKVYGGLNGEPGPG